MDNLECNSDGAAQSSIDRMCRPSVLSHHSIRLDVGYISYLHLRYKNKVARSTNSYEKLG